MIRPLPSLDEEQAKRHRGKCQWDELSDPQSRFAFDPGVRDYLFWRLTNRPGVLEVRVGHCMIRLARPGGKSRWRVVKKDSYEPAEQNRIVTLVTVSSG